MADGPTTAPTAREQASINGGGDDAGPTTAPSDEIVTLIRQLGDSSFHVRQQASQRLKEIGRPALPALKGALKAADPEIQLRAQELIDGIEHPPLPGNPPSRTHFSRSVRVTIINGAKTVDATEGDRTVHIEQDASGIRMKVAGPVDGKEKTQEYKAATAEELKKNDPDAYALYQRYALGAGNIVIRGIGIENQIVVPPPPEGTR